MNRDQIAATVREHELYTESGRAFKGHALVRALRYLKRRGVRFGRRHRVPVTDAMCLSYHGGWKCCRYLYLRTPRGVVPVGTLYDRLSYPPLTLGQRQRLEAFAQEMKARVEPGGVLDIILTPQGT